MWLWSVSSPSGLLDILENRPDDAFRVLSFPAKYRVRFRTTNMLKRVYLKLQGCDRVLQIFPNEASALWLMEAHLLEQHESWSTGKRYINMEEYDEWKAGKKKLPDNEKKPNNVVTVNTTHTI